MNTQFSDEQKQYLEGFLSGLRQSGLSPFAGETVDGRLTDRPEPGARNLAVPAAPPDTVFGTAFERLCKEERLKLEKNPFDMWTEMAELAARNEYVDGGDVFRFKFHGLFNCSPAESGYMLRCRIPGCVLSARQLEGLARICEEYGGGEAHVTTRGNLQVRRIRANHTVDTIMALYDAGLTSRGAGADNVRNITASPIAGVDPTELIDGRPMARAMHHYILNCRDLYGLPRKFNIAFDGGGAISIMAGTNDLGFQAVEVRERSSVEPGIYFHPLLGGVAGHGHFARPTHILLEPSQCVAFAAAMLRVYVERGNRTNRKRARVVYLIEQMGLEPFLEAVAAKLTFAWKRVEAPVWEPRRSIDRFAHIGARPQREPGFQYLGVALTAGRLTVDQMRGLAAIAARDGDGTLRLTVWQNPILTGIPDARIDAVKRDVESLGLHHAASHITSGLVACTGNSGCKFSQTDTKDLAARIARHFQGRPDLDHPLSVVITGCPNSCAQHVCADIGMLGIKSRHGEESIEAYNISVGGGTDQDQGLGREVLKAVPHDAVPETVEHITRVYQARRRDGETFLLFVRRHSPEQLRAFFQGAPA